MRSKARLSIAGESDDSPVSSKSFCVIVNSDSITGGDKSPALH